MLTGVMTSQAGLDLAQSLKSDAEYAEAGAAESDQAQDTAATHAAFAPGAGCSFAGSDFGCLLLH